MYPKAVLSGLVLCFFAVSPARAGSAVAFGLKSVHSNDNMESREIAVQKALEACSKADTNCRILTKCESEGFGALAIERTGGYLRSVGAICGVDSPETAKEAAMTRCNENARTKKGCRLKAEWLDE